MRYGLWGIIDIINVCICINGIDNCLIYSHFDRFPLQTSLSRHEICLLRWKGHPFWFLICFKNFASLFLKELIGLGAIICKTGIYYGSFSRHHRPVSCIAMYPSIIAKISSGIAMKVGIVMGNPGVFQGYLYLYPWKPIPATKGRGFGRSG